MSYQTIKPEDCRTLNQPFELIDVRTPAEFEQIHAEGAQLVPLDKLDAASLPDRADDGGKHALCFICRTGDRAKRAAERFASTSDVSVYVVEGGTEAWEAAGLPVRRGRKTISLERQVRIGAGSLVLVGVLLGWLIHPLFYLLSAFVGAGLVFAGVTDTCGMAMVLARMPWNQRGPRAADDQSSDEGSKRHAA